MIVTSAGLITPATTRAKGRQVLIGADRASIAAERKNFPAFAAFRGKTAPKKNRHASRILILLAFSSVNSSQPRTCDRVTNALWHGHGPQTSVLVLSSLLFSYGLPHAGQLCIICGRVIPPIMSRLWVIAPRRSGFFGRHIALGPPSP
jgi:hypothetical protein